MTPRRPDPDALLAHVAAADERERRGKLKVFLGAAPGVGKTFAMLNAARELVRQGVDVVVGLIETHGRKETEALLEGLEVLPRKQLDYKGHPLEELDLDALLARRPQVALVDELAHSNVPGARHQRRFQDVEELLDAGIDVFTTVNVQHLESLNDVVEQITGVKVRETVPDVFLDRLRDIVLVDLPPRELIERLRQGKVYVPDRARMALERFFSPSNLTALRELAMQTAADRIDADLKELGALSGSGVGAGIRRRVLVAVDGHEHTEYLVRVGRRIAERRQAPWTVAYVDTGRAGARTDHERLNAAFELAQRLGATTVVLSGVSVAAELVAYAQSQGVSSIVIGRTRERPLTRLLNRTITQQLLNKGARFELTIVNTPIARARSRRRLARPQERSEERSELARELGFATAASAGAMLLCAAAGRFLPVASLALVFVCTVIVVGARSRTTVALYAAVLCFLGYNLFFTEPRLSLRIASAHDALAVFSFLVAALVCGHLASRLHAQVKLLRAANDKARALQALGERLGTAADEAQIFAAGGVALATALGCEVVALRRAGGGPLAPVSAQPQGLELSGNDLAAADWVASHAQPAGRFTATLSASPWWFLPLVVEGGCLGAVGLRFAAGARHLPDERRQLAFAMVQQLALAAERAELARSLEVARLESETERLRTALLSSVSHDLRSPLAAMIGAATSLSAYGEQIPEAERRELLDSIKTEGERLDRYIQNLLDMTRLGSGPMKLQRDWVGLDEMASSAIARLRKLAPGTEVQINLPADLPLLWVHPALVEQALFNILENAAKFSPPGQPVTVAARRSENRLVVDVSDRGPGIPEGERRKIFDLFWSSARGDRGQRGTGLGLTIVRGMVGAHGGKVEALAGPGGVGTTLRVTLPLVEPNRGSGANPDG